MTERLYTLTDLNGRDVLGGAVSGENVYIKTYGKVLDGYKPVKDLGRDESTKAEYRLSRQNATVYRITRVR